MRRPIRAQILLPFTAVLLTAVAVTSIASSWLAARRSELAIVTQLNRMIATLSQTRFPWSRNVLDTMKGLSGAEFVLFDERDRPITATEGVPVPLPVEPPHSLHDGELLSLGKAPIVVLGERRYFSASVRRRGAAPSAATLLLLFPVGSWERARADAAIPPLVVGGATLGVLFFAAAWLASRMAARIRRVEQQVARIAGGEFVQLAMDGRPDEISDLTASVNRMSQQLQQQQTLLSQTERSRLLGQLAGGLAHQLRNAATGARMAVQIHLRRCGTAETDDSLEIALRQLSLMEEQMRGLLSLGKTERRLPVARTLAELLSDVQSLVSPICHHQAIAWSATCEASGELTIHDAEGVRTAVVNLVLNGIDAAGQGGRVGCVARYNAGAVTIDVFDDGPGPPPEIAGNLFDLFVSGKPEGVGFGLALARQVAEERGGTIRWDRTNDVTHFLLTIPGSAAAAGVASAQKGFPSDEPRPGG